MEAARWEDDYWEAFSERGDAVVDEDGWLVPLGTLLGADPALEPVAELPIGTGVRRTVEGNWEAWVSKH
jgi:hypothetical protein